VWSETEEEVETTATELRGDPEVAQTTAFVARMRFGSLG
jgi:hypothetical protein